MPGTKMPALIHSCYILLLASLALSNICSIVRAQQNSTLIFAAENNIRNCSCSTDIPDCDYNLAQLMCSCKTVLLHTVRQAVPRFRYTSGLTVWFKDASTLGLLVNFTLVHDLKLSRCESTPLPTTYLAILGLRRLRVQSLSDALFAQQSLVISNDLGSNPKGSYAALSVDTKALLAIAYLDTALCNGNSSLKSYSVENVSNIGTHFPNLPYSNALAVSNKTYTVTLIY
ncbi:exosomal polycystin-1-interacting protein isoform X2 [Ambystoma mexicanum]